MEDDRKFHWYKLYAFVVGRAYDERFNINGGYWFYSYCVYPQPNKE